MHQHLVAISLLALLELTSAQSPGEVACSYLDGVFAACTAQDSLFAQRPLSQRASCLCYEPTAWNPDNYDQPYRTCGSYIKTASPAAYASITSQNGPLPTAPCRDTGNVRNYPEKDLNQAACQQIDQLAAYCVANFPGYVATAPFPSLAPCLCYRNGNPALYQGPLYDSIASSCLNYLQTASPQNYQQVVGPNGGKRPDPPCQSVKNNPAVPSTSSPVPITTPPTPGNTPSVNVGVPTTTKPPTLTTTTSQPGAPVAAPSSSSNAVDNSPQQSSSQIDGVVSALSSSVNPGFLIPGIASNGVTSTRSADGGTSTRSTARPFVPVTTSVSVAGSIAAESLWLKVLGILVAWMI